MNLELKDKVAIVTGASAGLGKAIAFSLAGEGARSDNVLVNCASPGLIDSPQNDRHFSREEKRHALGGIPLRRFGDPREFADVVTFLCSERASYVTGVNLLVDGGASRGA